MSIGERSPERRPVGPGRPGWHAGWSVPSGEDLGTLQQQLGRPVRDVIAVSARDGHGAPAVIATWPRLSGGAPFPTFYYLTLPRLVTAVSRLEAAGVMAQLTEQLGRDERLREAYRTAHAAYLRDREAFGVVPEIRGVSAGGMPVRVKCLHALVAHALAAGPGVNPIGDLVLERLRGGRRGAARGPEAPRSRC